MSGQVAHKTLKGINENPGILEHLIKSPNGSGWYRMNTHLTKTSSLLLLPINTTYKSTEESALLECRLSKGSDHV
jgi:hypothetical protein